LYYTRCAGRDYPRKGRICQVTVPNKPQYLKSYRTDFFSRLQYRRNIFFSTKGK